MKCEDTQKRLKAFVSNDLDTQDNNTMCYYSIQFQHSSQQLQLHQSELKSYHT